MYHDNGHKNEHESGKENEGKGSPQKERKLKWYVEPSEASCMCSGTFLVTALASVLAWALASALALPLPLPLAFVFVFVLPSTFALV